MVQNTETDKRLLQHLSCIGEEKPKKPHQQLQILDFVFKSFYQRSRGAGYEGCFRPVFVRPCSNFVRPCSRQEPMDFSELSQPEEQIQESEQLKKKEHPLEGFLPSKNPNLPKNSFGEMDKLRKFQV